MTSYVDGVLLLLLILNWSSLSQVELGRPGVAIANPDGNFALVPYSKYSLKDKKCVLVGPIG